MFYGAIEGTGFEVLDPRFNECLTGHGRVERLWSGARWAEGPAWFAAGRYLVWSDIPNNRMLRYDETDGSVSVFRNPCKQFQWQYGRPGRPPGLMRASGAARDPHGA